jgi:hypothetical protein
MKDQYAGDVNDYAKYALLRAFAAVHGGTLQVWWMRTASDGRTDGARLGYLKDPRRYRALDPPLFDALREMVGTGRRSVRTVQDADILAGGRFHPALLGDDPIKRARQFDRILGCLGSKDLVFFDPDNGLQVKSVPAGKRNCCKYLYWDELDRALGEQRSAVVYQHFPRVQRAAFVERLLANLRGRYTGHDAFAVSSAWVVYLVCGRPARVRRMRRETLRLAERTQPDVALTVVSG